MLFSVQPIFRLVEKWVIQKRYPFWSEKDQGKIRNLVLSKDTVFQMRDDVSMLEVRHCHLCPSGQQIHQPLVLSLHLCIHPSPAPPQGTFLASTILWPRPPPGPQNSSVHVRRRTLISVWYLIIMGCVCVCARLWCIFQRIRRMYSVIERIFTFWEGTWSWLKVVDKWDLSFIWFIIVFE